MVELSMANCECHNQVLFNPYPDVETLRPEQKPPRSGGTPMKPSNKKNFSRLQDMPGITAQGPERHVAVTCPEWPSVHLETR